jgi:hypothetical protein
MYHPPYDPVPRPRMGKMLYPSRELLPTVLGPIHQNPGERGFLRTSRVLSVNLYDAVAEGEHERLQLGVHPKL